MRRKDKEIVSRAEIDAIIRDSPVCRLALARDNEPYLVPVSFGYDGSAIYLHTAPAGRKIDFFLANPRVCFEFERNVEVRTDPALACKWTMRYESVIGWGTIAEVTEPAEKGRVLNAIMRQYSGRDWTFEPAAVARVRTWRITIEQMTAKRSPPGDKP